MFLYDRGVFSVITKTTLLNLLSCWQYQGSVCYKIVTWIMWNILAKKFSKLQSFDHCTLQMLKNWVQFKLVNFEQLFLHRCSHKTHKVHCVDEDDIMMVLLKGKQLAMSALICLCVYVNTSLFFWVKKITTRQRTFQMCQHLLNWILRLLTLIFCEITHKILGFLLSERTSVVSPVISYILIIMPIMPIRSQKYYCCHGH